MDQEKFDVIVVGAGPVGLIFAQSLAQNHTVLLVEKEKTIAPRKSWAAPQKWIIEAGYGAYISNVITRACLYSYLDKQETFRMIPRNLQVATIDENQFYRDTIKSLKKSGGVISPNTEVRTYQYGNGGSIDVVARNSVFRGRLLLDCSGVDSPFIKRGDNFKHEFYWSVYGQTYSGNRAGANLSYLASIASHRGANVFINHVPEGNNHCTPWLFIMSPKKHSLFELRHLYSQAVKKTFLKDKLANHRPIKEKYGWIPAADVKSRARNQILSLGDAGALAPWQNSMSFSLMLKKLKVFTSRITTCLKDNKLDAENLNKVVGLDGEEELNFDLGKLSFICLMNCNGSELKRAMKAFGVMDPARLSRFVFFLDTPFKEFKSLLGIMLNYFSIREVLDILGRDGWADEIKIGGELISDFIKGLV